MVDHVFVLGEQRLRVRRLYAYDPIGLLHWTMATCVGAEPALADCEAALASVQLHVAGAVNLDAPAKAPPGEERDTAYRMGYALGQALPVIGVIAFALYMIRRSSRRARERAAARNAPPR